MIWGTARVRTRRRTERGEESFAWVQIRLAMLSLKKPYLLVKHNRRNLESEIQAPQTQSAFHRRAQRNAFRRRNARQQRRSYARWNPPLKASPNSIRLC